MSYIFLDESGDLGFNSAKKKTSKYFVITFLFTENKNKIEKLVKKVFRSITIKKGKKSRHTGVLHAHKESPKIRIKLLNLIYKEAIYVIAISLNKKKVFTNLRKDPHFLYGFVANILLERIYDKKLSTKDGNVVLIASLREKNKILNENFKNYLTSQLKTKHKKDIEVVIKTPHEEKCLQAVDFICWAINRKIEHKDDSYYKLIEDKAKITELFPD
jgi:hypothetical protein